MLVASISSGSKQASADPPPTPKFDLALNLALLNALAEPALDAMADPPSKFKRVRPSEFDPARTRLVQAAWLTGIGCPTQANVADYPATSPTGTYTDPACTSGDTTDHRNTGLLLVKTGPTSNNAAAVAELTNVKGMTLTEIGYDIRKIGPTHLDPRGSHCGGGAPRFNIVTTTDSYFLACGSPPPDMETPGTGWLRLRWGVAGVVVAYNSSFVLMPVTGTVKRIVIIFDEGQDPSGGPDQFGAAILDNIDVNGTLVGRGNSRGNDDHEESENDD